MLLRCTGSEPSAAEHTLIASKTIISDLFLRRLCCFSAIIIVSEAASIWSANRWIFVWMSLLFRLFWVRFILDWCAFDGGLSFLNEWYRITTVANVSFHAANPVFHLLEINRLKFCVYRICLSNIHTHTFMTNIYRITLSRSFDPCGNVS